MKVEKAQGERKVKTRERDNERVKYAVSSSVVSLHYEKSVLRPKWVRKHNDLRGRERERETVTR